MRDFLIDLLDAIIFHPVVEAISDHPLSVWIHSQPVWKLAIIDVFVATALAVYFGAFMYFLPLHPLFCKLAVQLMLHL